MNQLDIFLRDFDDSCNEALSPIVDLLIKQMEKEIAIEEANPAILFKTKTEQFKRNKHKLKKELLKTFSDSQNREKMRLGFELLLTDYSKIPNGEEIKEALIQAADRFSSEVYKLNELKKDKHNENNETGPIAETFQEIYQLSDNNYENIYTYALQRYHHPEGFKEANTLFYFLAELNPYRFEPWLYLGICQIELKSYNEALHAFSMASLVKLEHFLPHLYSAYCYLALNDMSLAKNTLELALSFANKTDQQAYKPMIDSIRAKLQ